jgi:hypothetical protein
MAKNFAVKLTNPTYGTVVFDVVQGSSASAAKSAAKADTGDSWAQEAGLNADPNVRELLSDTLPDPVYGTINSNPGH